MKPKNDFIIIKRAKGNGMAGLIIIPDRYKDRPSEGTVVAVPDNEEHLYPGLDVMFASFAGESFEHDGETLTSVPKQDILAILGDYEIPNA